MGRSAARTGLAALTLGLAACAGPANPTGAAGPDRSAFWDAAMGLAEFVQGDTAFQELWAEHARLGAPADLVARGRALGDDWKLLILAENWCSDAVYTVPFLAALADSLPGLELRLLRTDGHDALFHGHEKDGRAAHPLVLVLDADGRERGAWIERPAELAAWIDARRGSLSDDDLRLYRRGWYAGNAGRTAMAEIIGVMDDVRHGRDPRAAGPAVTAADREITPCPAP